MPKGSQTSRLYIFYLNKIYPETKTVLRFMKHIFKTRSLYVQFEKSSFIGDIKSAIGDILSKWGLGISES